jgi:hypothetical protein
LVQGRPALNQGKTGDNFGKQVPFEKIPDSKNHTQSVPTPIDGCWASFRLVIPTRYHSAQSVSEQPPVYDPMTFWNPHYSNTKLSNLQKLSRKKLANYYDYFADAHRSTGQS